MTAETVYETPCDGKESVPDSHLALKAKAEIGSNAIHWHFAAAAPIALAFGYSYRRLKLRWCSRVCDFAERRGAFGYFSSLLP